MAENNNKYDRQLRLWGSNGQKALMESHILVITAGCTGTETLKNLVLPGVGHFTIIDSCTVNESDLGSNFFVTYDSIGQPRAEVVCKLLTELNSDVKGSSCVGNIEQILSSNPNFLTQFDLIVSTQISHYLVKMISRICWDSNIPLLVCRSYGLIGTVRTQVRGHTVIEPKLDNKYYDLRISAPWDELAKYSASINMDSLDSKEHSHIPYIIILLHALSMWKECHNGQMPCSFTEKIEFKESIKKMARNFQKELNFQEAYENAHKAYEIPAFPVELESLLKCPDTQNLTCKSSTFHILLHALSDFIQENNVLPLIGEIPDMTSETDGFILLQEMYKSKANSDVTLMSKYVQILLHNLEKPIDSVHFDEISVFCKNARNLMKLSTTSIHDEFEFCESTINEIKNVLDDPYDDPKQTPILWYLGLRATDIFYAKHGRYPGVMDNTVKQDAIMLHNEMLELSGNVGQTELNILTKFHALEICRYGAAEIHCIAAVIGGIASQEAVKILAHQYAPLDNTVVYNGISNVMGVYCL